MAGHTPGPWVYESNESDGFYNTVSVDDHHPGRIIVAEVQDQQAKTEANGRLIAAAPELLEACKLALEEGDMFAAQRSVIEAAIAKAEGWS